MYRRKAFVHWYTGEGMDEMEFVGFMSCAEPHQHMAADQASPRPSPTCKISSQSTCSTKRPAPTRRCTRTRSLSEKRRRLRRWNERLTSPSSYRSRPSYLVDNIPLRFPSFLPPPPSFIPTSLPLPSLCLTRTRSDVSFRDGVLLFSSCSPLFDLVSRRLCPRSWYATRLTR
jgi:hypothetical protein